MHMLLALIASHLLTILENLLIQAEPAIVALAQKEAHLLIEKIESLLEAKAPKVASNLGPTFNMINTISNDAIEALGNTAVQDISKASQGE
jgi:hypothetical protein